MRAAQCAVLALVCLTGPPACSTPDPRAEAFAKLPDWRGIWIAEGHDAGISGFSTSGGPTAKVFKLIDLQAPWTDAARAKLLEALNGSGARKAQGWGYPMMMDAYAPIQFVITSEEVLITNSYHEVRQIYTDGRSHPKEEDRWATTWGDSVGHWEGGTLVIDTIAVRDPTRYFIFAPPLSEEAHYVERLRKMGADRIEAEFTIEDTVTLTRPWTVKTAYVRAPNLDRLVPDAFENDRSEVEGDAFGIRPPKD